MALTLVQQFFEALEIHNKSRLMQICHKNFNYIDGDRLLTLEEWLMVEYALLTAFPDRTYSFYRESYDGRMTTGSMLINGTHTGALDLTVFSGRGVYSPTNTTIDVAPEYVEIEEIDNQIYAFEVFPEDAGGWSGVFSQIGLTSS